MLCIQIKGDVDFPMTVHETSTVSEILEKIKEKGNIQNINQIQLFYQSKILKDLNAELKTFKIQQNAILRYSRKGSIIGGGYGIEFADITNKEGLEKLNFNKDAKKWNMITKGLNIEGICRSNCEAQNEKVDCQIGLGVFNFLENIDEIKCPMCGCVIEPITCSFSKCQYQIEGKISESGEVKDVKPTKTEWIRVEKDYDYYNPLKTGKVSWYKLIIR